MSPEERRRLIEKAAAALRVCDCREGRNQHGYWRVLDNTCPACGDPEAKAATVIDVVLGELGGAA